MTINITSPVTGSAQTGLTSPTYTLVTDIAPSINGRQYAVTALGGTQTGVDVSSVAKPFTISVFRPAQLKQPGIPNAVNGVLPPQGKNNYRIITRKGVVPLAGQAPQLMTITTEIAVPAGADTADSEDIRAALSLHVGALSQQSAGIGDTSVSGVL